MANKEKKIMKVHVKKGDTVMVISGKDESKTGKVVKVFPTKGMIVVDGLNIVKRHTKARPPQFPQGGIIEKSMPMRSCKVMLVCTKCDKPVRVKKELSSDGTSYRRICSKCGEEIK